MISRVIAAWRTRFMYSVSHEVQRGRRHARAGLHPYRLALLVFAPLLGWLGVALTGSDTSCNALFGSLQRITAEQLGLNPG